MRLLDDVPFLIFVCVINLIPGIYGVLIDATGIAGIISSTCLDLFFLSAVRLIYIWYRRQKFVNEAMRAMRAESENHAQDDNSTKRSQPN